MGVTLVEMGLCLLWGWGWTYLERNYYSRPRGSGGRRPWGELEWRLAMLIPITAIYLWALWRYLSH